MITVYQLATRVYNHIKHKSPIDTGNLRYNAINLDQINKQTCKVYIDGRIAPYTVYTNEKWVSPRWHGRSNPNEKWIDIAVTEAVVILAQELGGTITKATGTEDRWFNREYWEKVRNGEIIRNDNITGIE